MYSNDFTQIRAGLTNYVGASLKAVNLPTDKAKKQAVSAMLIEEAIKLSTDEDGNIDLYTIKPVYRATVNLLKIRIAELNELPSSVEIQSTIAGYQVVVKKLDTLIANIN